MNHGKLLSESTSDCEYGNLKLNSERTFGGNMAIFRKHKKFIFCLIIVTALSEYGIDITGDIKTVSANSSFPGMKRLSYELRQNMKAYASLIEAKNNGENVRKEIVQVLRNIIDTLKAVKKIYDEFSQTDYKVRQAVERMERLIIIYEKKLVHYQ